MRALVLFPLLSVGCAKSIIPLYEAARDDALREPGAVPAKWEPDATLSLSYDALDGVIGEILATEGTLSEKIDAGVVELRPKLEVQSLAMSQSKRCDDCLSVDVTLDGSLRWFNSLLDGKTDIKVGLDLDAKFEAVQEGQSWVVTVQPQHVREVEVEIGKIGGIVGDLVTPVQDWLDAQLVANIPPHTLTEFAAADLPVRSMRLAPTKTLDVELLVGTGDALKSRDRTVPSEDWRLQLSSATLVQLARRAAFEEGEVGYDVVVDPTSLSMDADSFELGLRLWRIKGKGWWRDYVIHGSVETKPRRVVLTPTDVVEGDKSPGAVFVDPIAALGEGVILRTIEDAVATGLPSTRDDKIGDLRTTVTLTSVNGSGQDVSLGGTLEVAAPAAKKKKKKSKKSRGK